MQKRVNSVQRRRVANRFWDPGLGLFKGGDPGI